MREVADPPGVTRTAPLPFRLIRRIAVVGAALALVAAVVQTPSRADARTTSASPSPIIATIMRDAPSSAARRAAFYALMQQGKPYTQAQGRRTGDFNNGFDCSGLVWRAYVQSGVWLGGAQRYTQSIIADRQLRPISRNQLRPGDLIFMTMPGGIRNGHVVMSLGGDRIVEASSQSGNVRVNTLTDKFLNGGRDYRYYRVRAR
jgi:cell wall-associated NlpC family hydrolase